MKDLSNYISLEYSSNLTRSLIASTIFTKLKLTDSLFKWKYEPVSGTVY